MQGEELKNVTTQFCWPWSYNKFYGERKRGGRNFESGWKKM
jgi:hypothetical protein